MSFLPMTAAAVTLNLCFPGGPSGTSPEGQCVASLQEEDLRGSVANRKTPGPAALRRAVDNAGHEQARGGDAALANTYLSDLEADAMASKITTTTVDLRPAEYIETGPGGVATITTDYQIGQVGPGQP